MTINLGQNKFYVGLAAALGLGCLIFGLLLFQSYSNFSDAEQKYNEQVTELNRLQTLELYPEAKNQKALEDQMQAAHEAMITLHERLVPMSFPLEPMTPEQFQDKLNAAAKDLGEKAASAGVNLPDKLYLGFAEYRTVTPKPEAAAALGRQLKCIALVVDEMIEKKVASIDRITRVPLPEEENPDRPAANAQTKEAPKSKLLTAYPFEVQFSAEQKAFQSVLNDLSKNDKQFFILRPLAIKNQSEKSPKKIDPNAAKETAVKPASGTAAATPSKMRYVLGAEKLNVTLRIDSVVFTSKLPK